MTISQTQFQDMMTKNLTPFRQDAVGNNSIVMAIGTEALFVNNGLARNDKQGPSYLGTDGYDISTGIFAMPNEYDGPVYVANVNFKWTMISANAGKAIIREYINTSGTKNFSTDPLIGTYELSYIGTTDIPRNEVITWYLGDAVGYDAKNDGTYFTIETEHAGTVSEPATVYYSTQ